MPQLAQEPIHVHTMTMLKEMPGSDTAFSVHSCHHKECNVTKQRTVSFEAIAEAN